MTTTTEWRTEFDLLYNNILSDQAPGLNDYEISVLLTQAQEELIIALYSGRRLEPFESTEEVKEYLANLVQQAVITQEKSVSENEKINKNSHFYTLPGDLWFKTFEKVTVRDDSLNCRGSKEREMIVIPTTQDELDRTINNPFKGHGDRRVLSLTPSPFTSELISKYEIVKYVVRYLRKPKPIILKSLAGTGLSINGDTAERTCELHESLHSSILQRAVELARGLWENTVQSQSRQ